MLGQGPLTPSPSWAAAGGTSVVCRAQEGPSMPEHHQGWSRRVVSPLLSNAEAQHTSASGQSAEDAFSSTESLGGCHPTSLRLHGGVFLLIQQKPRSNLTLCGCPRADGMDRLRDERQQGWETGELLPPSPAGSWGLWGGEGLPAGVGHKDG